MTTASSPSDETGGTVWLWQWNRDTDELEKVGVPAASVPAGWVEPLQRRYAPGDRILYTIDDEHGWQPGTVVKDQGLYVAINGDAPGRYTTHKTVIQLLTDEPSAPPRPDTIAALTATPHADPEIRTSHRSINARWPLGGPVAPGTQWQASLTVHHAVAQGGYRAVLRTVVEQRSASGVSERWSNADPPRSSTSSPHRATAPSGSARPTTRLSGCSAETSTPPTPPSSATSPFPPRSRSTHPGNHPPGRPDTRAATFPITSGVTNYVHSVCRACRWSHHER